MVGIELNVKAFDSVISTAKQEKKSYINEGCVCVCARTHARL